VTRVIATRTTTSETTNPFETMKEDKIMTKERTETPGKYEAGKGEVTLPRVRPHHFVRLLDGSYEVRVDLPGVSREDIDIKTEQNQVTINAIRRYEVPGNWRSLYRETRDTHYHLILEVNAPIDGEAIAAKLENGQLILTLPLREEHKPRQIAIE